MDVSTNVHLSSHKLETWSMLHIMQADQQFEDFMTANGILADAIQQKI